METVAAYWEHFAETRGRRLTNATLSRYAHSMGKHVLPELGGVALRDLRHVDVQRMVDACPTRGTAIQAKRSLSAVLGYAVAEGVIERNPVAGRLELPPDAARAVGDVDVAPFAAPARPAARKLLALHGRRGTQARGGARTHVAGRPREGRRGRAGGASGAHGEGRHQGHEDGALREDCRHGGADGRSAHGAGGGA